MKENKNQNKKEDPQEAIIKMDHAFGQIVNSTQWIWAVKEEGIEMLMESMNEVQ